METAYYAKKIPLYEMGLANGTRQLANTYEIRKIFIEKFEEYNCKIVCAHNARFDYNACNNIMRWTTKSKYRWFFPYGTKVCCIWHMACQTICSMKKYHKFCTDNGFVSKAGNIQTSAEVVYAFLTNNPDFEEEHKGLEDVLIEAYIFAECVRKHKRMNRKINRACWRIPQRKSAV